MSVEFIISVYDRIEPLRCILASLMAQTDDDWSANVVIDGERPLEGVLEVIEKFETHKIYYTPMDRRYDDYGHSCREIGKQASKAKYIIMTNDDNYYTPNTVSEIKKMISSNPGMVYWDMIHSHYEYKLFRCTPSTGQIDMGAFATRADLAKQIHLTSKFDADGDFIEEFKRKFSSEKKVKIDKVLFVHN